MDAIVRPNEHSSSFVSPAIVGYSSFTFSVSFPQSPDLTTAILWLFGRTPVVKPPFEDHSNIRVGEEPSALY
jgi:hypothetical protein